MSTSKLEEGLPGENLPLQLGSEFEEDNQTLKLHLHLLGAKPEKLPRWMKHYRMASYIIYSIIAFYSIIYLIFIGVHQANPRFQIQYSAIVHYLEYNSYSILSPLLCPVLMIMLIYQVKYRIKLDEGDFFGVLGLLLLLALINVHDSWGILKILHWNKDKGAQLSRLHPPAKDETSRRDLHWQYAWSTRTVCARKFVRDLQYKYELSKNHVVRQIVFQNNNPIQTAAREALTDLKETPCNKYHDIKSNAKIREWMKDIQNEFKCCGPYGFNEWKEWFDQESKTGCKNKWKNASGEIKSCFEPVIAWLDKIMVATFWIMLIQGVFYIISMVLAGMHHSAMKYEEEKIERRYSLLSMTDNNIDPEPHWWSIPRPPDKAVIVGEFPPRPIQSDTNDAEGDLQNAPRGTSGSKGKIGDDDDAKSKSSKKKKKKGQEVSPA